MARHSVIGPLFILGGMCSPPLPHLSLVGSPADTTPLPFMLTYCTRSKIQHDVIHVRPGSDQWTFTEDNTCEIYKKAFYPTPCTGGISGYHESGPPACNCSRVHKTVGRENLTSSSGHGHYPAGGEWFSHPVEGECVDGHYVGDGSGCTWRVVGRNKIINATCMYKHLDQNVESYDPSCFSACE